jgi:energy-coupling factor transporter ATP-binding protein EcfA2
MIELRNVTYAYPSTTRPALDRVSFRLSAGEVIGLIGANGAGKSTLCYALAGYVPQFFRGTLRGEVHAFGRNVSATPVGELAAEIGLVFHNPFNQISGARFSVLEEVAFGLENLGLPPEEIEVRADQALQLTGLADLAERSPFTLSGGEQQRLAIASILAMQPRLLVLDEPTSQLDPAGTRAVFEVLRRMAGERGTTIVIAEHKLARLCSVADRLLALAEGRLVADGPPRQVLSGVELGGWGIGATRLTQAARGTIQRGLHPASPDLPVTVEDAVEFFR